jgi:hypothetical protein
MKGDTDAINAPVIEFFQQDIVEMQARGGRRNRSGPVRIHRLVTFLVEIRILACNVGG